MVFKHKQQDKYQPKKSVAAPIDNKSVANAYKRWARFYDASFGFIVGGVRKDLAAQINQESSGTLLDVGVGTGVCLPLYKKDFTITGIDYTAEMLEKAKEKVEEKKLDNVVSLRQMDARSMAFPDNSFDNVVCLHVMSVVPDPVATFREIERVCKPGGRIYIANHFMCEKKGPRFYLEKAIAPASRLLGWHPDFSKKTLLDAAQKSHLVETRDSGCFKLFTIMTFVKEGEETES